jgi:hypothetical protein
MEISRTETKNDDGSLNIRYAPVALYLANENGNYVRPIYINGK